jgi:hypothetical protein
MKITLKELRSVIHDVINEDFSSSNDDPRAALYGMISDVSKDLYGSRWRFDWREYSLEDLQNKFDRLQDELDEELADAHPIENELDWQGPAQEFSPPIKDELDADWDDYEELPVAEPVRQPSRDRHRRHH